MKKEFLNKPGAEAGWALLRLTFEEGDPEPRPEEKFRLSIEELPSGIFFQPAGPDFWPQEGPERYAEPHAQNFDGRTLTLELGPSVTGTFRSQLYAFHIKGSQGFPFTFNTSVKDLRRPAPGKIDLEVGAGPDPTLPPVEPVQPEPVQPEPIQPEPAQPEASEPEATESYYLDDPPSASKNKRPAWLVPGLVILLLLIFGLAGLGLWLWKRPGRPEPSAPPPPAAAGEEGQAEQAPGWQAQGAAPAGETPLPLEEVRELLRRGAGTAELEAALTRLDQVPGAEDAVFLLAKALATRSPEHRVRYAAFMDPTDTRPAGSIKKDPLAAYEEYESAKSAGAPEAAAALDRLLKWAEENAGQPDAARLWRRYGEEKP